jgi:YbbR domain-containing protein
MEGRNTRTLGRLLLSLVLAIVLWGWVTTSRDPETERSFNNIPVSAVNLSGDLVLVTDIPSTNVRVTGPRSAVNRLVSTDIVATIDFGDIIEAGSYTMRISLDVPDDIWSSESNPETVNLVIERQTAKSMPVTPQLSGAPGSNQQVGRITPEVSEVTVSGPRSLVDRVSAVELRVDITDRTTDFSGVFEPVAVDADGQPIAGVTLNPNSIAATVEITARGKRVAVIAQITGDPAPGFEVVDRLINPGTVLVDGPPEILESMITVSTEVVDISGAEDDVASRVEIAPLSEGVTLLEPRSGLVDVVVQIRQRGQQQPLPSQQVTVLNLAPGLEATVEPTEVLVNVVGNEQEIESLSATSLIVQVDARGLGPGVYELTPTVVLPPRMEWTRIEPMTVTVTITAASTTEATPQSSPVP